MSRYSIHHNSGTYTYGRDHVLGIFFEKSHYSGDKLIQDFDISEFVNFIDHPKFPKPRTRNIRLEEIIEIIEYEVKENEFPMPQEHLELIKSNNLSI